MENVMNTKEALVNKHPNYRLMFLNEEQLREELISWNRHNLISWLKWNDSNGVYEDKQSLQELGNIITYQEGVEIIVNQIIQ